MKRGTCRAVTGWVIDKVKSPCAYWRPSRPIKRLGHHMLANICTCSVHSRWCVRRDDTWKTTSNARKWAEGKWCRWIAHWVRHSSNDSLFLFCQRAKLLLASLPYRHVRKKRKRNISIWCAGYNLANNVRFQVFSNLNPREQTSGLGCLHQRETLCCDWVAPLVSSTKTWRTVEPSNCGLTDA